MVEVTFYSCSVLADLCFLIKMIIIDSPIIGMFVNIRYVILASITGLHPSKIG